MPGHTSHLMVIPSKISSQLWINSYSVRFDSKEMLLEFLNADVLQYCFMGWQNCHIMLITVDRKILRRRKIEQIIDSYRKYCSKLSWIMNVFHVVRVLALNLSASVTISNCSVRYWYMYMHIYMHIYEKGILIGVFISIYQITFIVILIRHSIPIAPRERTIYDEIQYERYKLRHVMRKPVFAICEQQRRRSFVVRCMDSIIPSVSISKNASMTALAGFCLTCTWSQTPKTGFPETWLK